MLTSIGRSAASRSLARSSLKFSARRAGPSTSTSTSTSAYLKATASAGARSFTTTRWSHLPEQTASTKAAKSGSSAKKASSKAKTKVAKPKAAAKKKPAPKKKKVALTPEQKQKEEIKHLKAAALHTEPKKLPETTWTVYLSQNVSKGETDLGSHVKQVSVDYKNLGSSELQRLQDTASRNKLSNEEGYKSWVEGLDPKDVHAANTARARLNRILPKGRLTAFRSQIRDDRLPKRARTAYNCFCQERWNSGVYTGASQTDTLKEIAAEYKTLSESEKQKYIDEAEADRERYVKEMRDVLGKEVRGRASSNSS